MFREFQVFVKPVGARCNLNCNYCYYLEKDFQGAGEGPGVMSPELLERYITGHLEASSDQSIIFSWHGGEPTLAGIDFYRKALEIQKKYQIPGTKIVNGIQTNGTLLHMEWCKFLKEEGFAVGISLDGPRVFHDRFRTGKNRHSTFDRVLQGYTLLKKYEVPTEVLCVVNAVNVAEPLEIYRFFKELGVKYLTFLPLVERKQGSFSEVTERSVPSLDFGAFLSAIFDEWVEQDIGAIKIQVFEEATRSAFRQEHTLCIFKKGAGVSPWLSITGISTRAITMLIRNTGWETSPGNPWSNCWNTPDNWHSGMPKRFHCPGSAGSARYWICAMASVPKTGSSPHQQARPA